jgi:hypothetical protein
MEVCMFSSLGYRHGVFAKAPLDFLYEILSSCVPCDIYFVAQDSTASPAIAWASVNPIFELGQRAKQLAQRSTDEGREAQDRVKMSRRTVQNAQERLRRATSQVSKTFGESVRRIDAAWPGDHTRRMYDDLSKRQASILAQLRTGMTPLNVYLHNIKSSGNESLQLR